MWVVFVRAQDRFTSKKPKFSEAYPEAAIREGADELTLRAEEVRTLTACINIDHSENDRWRPPLVDADWHAFCEAIEEVYCHYREMSRAAATKKPSESEKAKALWAMKAAKEREKEYYDSARKDNMLGRRKTRLELWEEHLQDPIAALEKALTCLENPSESGHWFEAPRGKLREWQWPAVVRVLEFCKRCGKKPFCEGVWPQLDPWDSVRLRTASTCWNVPRKCGPHGELFFFLLRKEPVGASDDEASNPFVSAETLKACGLIGLHLLAVDTVGGSSGSQSPDLHDMWRQGGPRSPE